MRKHKFDCEGVITINLESNSTIVDRNSICAGITVDEVCNGIAGVKQLGSHGVDEKSSPLRHLVGQHPHFLQECAPVPPKVSMVLPLGCRARPQRPGWQLLQASNCVFTFATLQCRIG